MKKLLQFLALILLLQYSVRAQIPKGADQGLGHIVLAPVVIESSEAMSESSRVLLENRLNQICTASGVSGMHSQSRFVLAATVNILSKDITSTAPVMVVYNLEIILHIGDGIEGTKFSSHTVTLKGVGDNETKAYVSAIRTLKTNDPQYKTFIEKGKAKIVDYYTAKCDMIIKEGQTLAQKNDFDEAIFKLASIPDACLSCYNKAIVEIQKIYLEKINTECKSHLIKAKSIWVSNQDINAANNAAEELSAIDPKSSCYAESKSLFEKIESRVKELDEKNWAYKMKVKQAEEDERMALINAARDVGVAYGQGQPKAISYNLNGW
jgi:hypothetical protein